MNEDSKLSGNLRRAVPWAALFAAAFLIRTVIDWLWPTTDFHIRASASTAIGVAILFLAAFLESFRSKSFGAGFLAACGVAMIAAPFELFGALLLLAIRHDAATMAAIQESGGIGEVFTLPLMMVLPGFILGALGSLLGLGVSILRAA